MINSHAFVLISKPSHMLVIYLPCLKCPPNKEMDAKNREDARRKSRGVNNNIARAKRVKQEFLKIEWS